MLNPQISDEAADWFVTLRDGQADAQAQERFMEWLRKSPEHVRAYLETVALWKDLPQAADERSSADLIAVARAEGNVFSLERQSVVDAPRARRYGEREAGRGSFRRRPAFAVAATLAAVSAGALGWFNFFDAPSHATGLGEQRALMLEDGSRVELNSDSRVRIHFDGQHRRVELLKGQALFQVAKDPDRPFVVESGTAHVRAVGTQFDVFRRRNDTVITVVEGRVAVTSASKTPAAKSATQGAGSPGAGGPVLLSAGEGIIVAPQVGQRRIKADVAAATAWTRGQLMFRSAPLSDVIAEFNRYNTRQLRLGEAVENFPVTAVFASTDPRMLIEFLRQQADVEVKVAGDEIRIVPVSAP